MSTEPQRRVIDVADQTVATGVSRRPSAAINGHVVPDGQVALSPAERAVWIGESCINAKCRHDCAHSPGVPRATSLSLLRLGTAQTDLKRRPEDGPRWHGQQCGASRRAPRSFRFC